jgi:cytidine deaminase
MRGRKRREVKVDFEKLTEAARAARKNAYAPYSKYWVGAAALGKSGKIYSGCNVENAAYPSGLCAERVAIFKGVSEGEREFIALAVVTKNAGSPCGACRQVFSEFAEDDAEVVVADDAGKIRQKFLLKEILPDRFGPKHLE